MNVNVVDIKTKEQHEDDSVSLQDRVTGAVESTGEFVSEQFENVKTGFSKVGGKSDIISFMVCYINTYRTKLFPYLKNIDSNFMKLKSRYRSENP